MLSDIYQEPCKVEVCGKEYLFEFNHASYAAFEYRTRKSIYEVFENLVGGENLSMDEVHAMIFCGLLKNHSVEEAKEFEKKLMGNEGLWFSVKSAVQKAFVSALLPPKISIEKGVFVNGKVSLSK